MPSIVKYAIGENEESIQDVMLMYGCSLEMLHTKQELQDNLQTEIRLIKESTGQEVEKEDCYVLKIEFTKHTIEEFLSE
jgi:hypothetical protein